MREHVVNSREQVRNSDKESTGGFINQERCFGQLKFLACSKKLDHFRDLLASMLELALLY